MTTTELNKIAKQLKKEVFITKIYSLEDRMALRFNEKTIEECEVEKTIFSLEVKKNVFINYFQIEKNDNLLFDNFYNAANGAKQNSIKRMLDFEIKFN